MVFVHDFLDIPLDFDSAAAALLQAEPEWLASLGMDGGRVDVEPAYLRGDAWVLPFHWRPTGAAPLFPQIEAELQVAPLAAGEVRLSLSGHYRPRLGEIGQLANAVLLHRVVERRVRVFLGDLAGGLRQAAASMDGPVSREAAASPPTRLG